MYIRKYNPFSNIRQFSYVYITIATTWISILFLILGTNFQKELQIICKFNKNPLGICISNYFDKNNENVYRWFVGLYAKEFLENFGERATMEIL